MKKRVCVIFGGESSEYEVSLVSATAIIKNLDKEKYEPVFLGITRDGKWYFYEGDTESIISGEWVNGKITPAVVSPSKNGGKGELLLSDGRRIGFDVVFPAVHGQNCEDGKLQAVFELMGVPCVGSGCAASAVCMDKSLTKKVLRSEGIPQADAIFVEEYELENGGIGRIRNFAEEKKYPVFVKPACAGSSVGASKVSCESELLPAVRKAMDVGGKILVETYIKGREIEVAVTGNEDLEVSVCGEINPGFDFYDYDTKYKNDTASYFIPARLSAKTSGIVREYAEKIFRSLGCRGYARVDFFVTDNETVFFNEINTLPGFTPISMYPKLMMNAGYSFGDVVNTLIGLAEKNVNNISK